MIKKYRKKPVIVEAVQFTGKNKKEIDAFVGTELDSTRGEEILIIETLEGDHQAQKGDFIVKGIKGEFYPVKPDIFIQTYEEVL